MKRLYHRLFYALILLICFASVLLQLHSGFVILAAAYDNAPSESETQDIPDPLEVYRQGGKDQYPWYEAFLRAFFDQYYDSNYNLDYFISQEMCRAYNNDFPHPYLAGMFNENGEAIIYGLKITSYYQGEYACVKITDLVIPNEIDGHPVTDIQSESFQGWSQTNPYFSGTAIVGDNISIIRSRTFDNQALSALVLGKNVETISFEAFNQCHCIKEIKSWGDRLKTIDESAFEEIGIYVDGGTILPPFPDTLESIGDYAFRLAYIPKTIVLPKTLKSLGKWAFAESTTDHLIVLNKDLAFVDDPFYDIESSKTITGYIGSTAEETAKKYNYVFYAIDGESLLFDGEPVDRKSVV